MELTTEQALEQGVAAHKIGKLQEAERLYRAILQAQPKNSDANHNLGVLAVSVNRVDLALPLFKTALKVNPTIEQYWFSYIDALVRANQRKDAKQAIKKAKKIGFDPKKLDALVSQATIKVGTKEPTQAQLNSLMEYFQSGQFSETEKLAISITNEFPKHPLSWKVLGALFGQIGRYPESVNANQTVVALSPKDAEAHSNLGVSLEELGRLDESEACYSKAITLKPDYSEAYHNLGNVQMKLGKLEEAKERYTDAIELKPNYAEAYNNLGAVLEKLGESDQAEASCRQAIALKPDYAEAYSNLGVTLVELGRVKEAEASLRHAIELRSDVSNTHFTLGNMLRKLGRLAEAETSFMQTIALKPDYYQAYCNLGITLQELGRFSEAETSYRRAIALKSDFASAHSNLGVTLQELGRLDDAEASQSLAIELNPDYAEAYNNLAITLKGLGRFEEAEARYAQAIALKPNFAEAHSNLGMTLKALGRLEEAEASYMRAIALKPNYAEAHSNLGAALHELGRLEEAEINYKKAIMLNSDFAVAARNILELPVGQLDPKTLDLCENMFIAPGEFLKDQVNCSFFQANLLKHRGLIDQSFSEFCKANKMKFEKIKDKISLESERNIQSFNRIKEWVPIAPASTKRSLVKLFIMGPSRSGKSVMEHILCKSTQVKRLFEAVNYSSFSSTGINKRNLPDSLFDSIFGCSEDEFLLQGYGVVTSTNPGSIFNADYLLDMVPNTYFLVINRDVQDLAAEIFTKEYADGNYYSYDVNVIYRYLSIYNNICEILIAKAPDRCITINFDDIIESPEATVGRIGELVSQSFEVGSLKKKGTKFASTSIFRDHFAEISEKY